MPELHITIDLPNTWDAHVCTPTCDCPRAIASAQVAIDTDRLERGASPRLLSERLHGMRNGAPEPEWFDTVAFQAQQMEDLDAMRARETVAGREAAAWAQQSDDDDAASHPVRRDRLRDVVAATVRDLQTADLLPVDHEYVYDERSERSRLYVRSRFFAAELTGALDTPAAHYVVITGDEADAEVADEPTERFTTDLNAVRAWLLAWACAPRL